MLGRIRLSRFTDESTSEGRQRKVIEQYADMHEHIIVGWAVDLNVSGSMDPFETPEFGNWLNNRQHEFDLMGAWKLDRYSRRTVPTHRLFGWCQDNGKTLVAVADNIDLSTWAGRLVASVIAGVAEGELEAIKERTKGSHAALRAAGRWPGGKPEYGFMAVPNELAQGWKLEFDEEAYPIRMEMVERALRGEAPAALAAELTERGVLTPSNHIRKRNGQELRKNEWNANSIRKLLRSKTLLGYVTHDAVTVRDDDGNPVTKGPAMITPDVYVELQAKLEERTKKMPATMKASKWQGCIECFKCHKSMNFRGQNTSSGRYEYYLCRDGHGQAIRIETITELLEKTFLEKLEGYDIQKRVYKQGSNNEVAIRAHIRELDERTSLLGAVASATAKERLRRQIADLDSKLAELESESESEGGYEYVSTGQTYGDAWKNGNDDARRQLLRDSGIALEIQLTGKDRAGGAGILKLNLNVPDELWKGLIPECKSPPESGAADCNGGFVSSKNMHESLCIE